MELDLGTVYIGVTNLGGIGKGVKRLAGLEDNRYPVGYPKRGPKPRKRKKGVEEVTRPV